VDQELIGNARRLRFVATPSTGTDHIDKPALAGRGIELLDIATEYDLLETFTATAEGTWALLLAALRRLPAEFERAKRGCVSFSADRPIPWQLSGKTLGVVGVGRLGRMVARYGKAFRMRVIGFDARSIDEPDVTQVDLDTLIRESDVISLHLHLTDQTHHIIDRVRIAQMKRGVVIVNTARGDLIDEAALLDALASGHVFAAGLDVIHNEWDPDLVKRPILEYARTHENLILTPHVASACLESITDARIFIAKKLAQRLLESGRRAHGTS
jgi:D-3-phosphoglycerate dehydrogenase